MSHKSYKEIKSQRLACVARLSHGEDKLVNGKVSEGRLVLHAEAHVSSQSRHEFNIPGYVFISYFTEQLIGSDCT